MTWLNASSEPCRLLAVGNDSAALASLAEIVPPDFHLLTATTADKARALFLEQRIDAVLVEQDPSDESGVEFLRWVRDRSRETLRLVMTTVDGLDGAAQALHSSLAQRCLIKPWQTNDVVEVLRGAARTLLLERARNQLLEELRAINEQLEDRVRQRTRELDDANSDLRQQNLKLQRLALIDPLTGLLNRRAMDQAAIAELRRRVRYPASTTLGLIDVDNFKDVNSRYLLPGGDEVLVGLSKALSRSVRTVDIVGRVGGEEFMVVAPETGRSGAAVLGERIRAAVEEATFAYRETPIKVTVSIGFGVAETGVPIEYDVLKHAAAAALQEAKRRGRNRCVVHSIQAQGQ
jgi:diguanylate cyclase (GGDEF)-like protein